MPTIDLTTPAPPPVGMLEGLPRRISLTLTELQLLAERAGNAPLPFELSDAAAPSALEGRLGASAQSSDDARFRAAVHALPDAFDSLSRRGLVDGATTDPGAIGALGLLAKPAVAVDLDVVVDGCRARAWHRLRDGAVATLATSDGLVFELAWFDAVQWAGELARAAALPNDAGASSSQVPALADLPFELLDAGSEAVRSGRTDLLAAIVAHHQGAAHDGAGSELNDTETQAIITALSSESRGRLRALVADIEAGGTTVGVVSLVLLLDGWHALTAYRDGDLNRVQVRAVQPPELSALLAPVLAEVSA
ncbi:hypothetical protein ACLM5J_08705 [Nocardioides sp. Bht2]|uniref:hypothetical protein n=1 Tax=Nocardioides sp. Bht2 TaxID=3392297 RepID=UPI0039B42CEE